MRFAPRIFPTINNRNRLPASSRLKNPNPNVPLAAAVGVGREQLFVSSRLISSANAAPQPNPHPAPLRRPRRARRAPPCRRGEHPSTHHPQRPGRLHHAVPNQAPLRLPDAAAHRRLSAHLAPRLRRTHAQRNLFFDDAARTLAAATAALRVRLYDGPNDRDAPSRAVLALKRRPWIDAALALACADDPARLGRLDSPIVRLVADEYSVGGDAAPFICLGGFRNTRAVYELEDEDEDGGGGAGGGLVLELDETRFDFGTSYELECETAEPDRVKEVLERLLTVAGVPYEYSRSNKFACFMAGKLLLLD
ncbi:hypothetical protein BDA96_07G234000 [Sorghum bicolor]|uniref:CYTH domain-containing protein n=1 Tax=Sorghum bicolor TaxID=4558 RepID=A0A921QQ38_SORBI|nr:hypothetical protein BDA96_07G234000 [Sorghum bicolor]